MTEKEFLKFHSEYFGEKIDDLKQLKKICFSGEELFEYIIKAQHSKNELALNQPLVSNDCDHPYHAVTICKMTELSKCSKCGKEWY